MTELEYALVLSMQKKNHGPSNSCYGMTKASLGMIFIISRHFVILWAPALPWIFTAGTAPLHPTNAAILCFQPIMDIRLHLISSPS
jgi:hypothetical protein